MKTVNHGRIKWVAMTFFALALPATHAQTNSTSEGPRYFAFIHYAGPPTIDPHEFIIEVRDPAMANQYKNMITNATSESPRVRWRLFGLSQASTVAA